MNLLTAKKILLIFFLLSCSLWSVIEVSEIDKKEFQKALESWEDYLPRIKGLNIQAEALRKLIEHMNKNLEKNVRLFQAKETENTENPELVEGLLMLDYDYLDRYGRKYLEITALSTAPWNLQEGSYRRKPTRGVGTALLNKTFEQARTSNLAGIVGHPVETAKEFYRKYFNKKKKEGTSTISKNLYIFTFKKN